MMPRGGGSGAQWAMPTVEITQSHQLTPDEARRRLEQLQEDLQQRYGLVPTWVSQRELRVTRSGANGTLRIEPHEITVRIDLPLLLSPLKGEIESRVRRELGELFAV